MSLLHKTPKLVKLQESMQDQLKEPRSVFMTTSRACACRTRSFRRSG